MSGNESVREGFPLYLEVTNSSFINSTLFDSDSSPEKSKPHNLEHVNKISVDIPPEDEGNDITPQSKHDVKAKSCGEGEVSCGTKTNPPVIGTNLNSPSPSHAVISDDFSACSFVMTVDQSMDMYSLDAANTDGKDGSFCPENLSCSMLSCNGEIQLQEFSAELIKRDEIIEELANSLEATIKQKEQQESEALRLAGEVEKLQKELKLMLLERAAQVEVNDRDTLQQSQFELSSYLNPPGELSTLISIPSRPETRPQSCQTDSPSRTSVDVCVQSIELDGYPTDTKDNFNNLLDSARALRTDFSALKSSVVESFAGTNYLNSEDIIGVVCKLFQKQNEECITLKRQYVRDIDQQNQMQIDLKTEIDVLKFKNEEVLRNKNEEIRLINTKMKQLEENKRYFDQKLTSLSTRLSPEGSELETDISVADSTSGVENHYHLTRTKMDYLKLTPPVECLDDGEILERSSFSDIPNSVVDDLKLQLSDLEKKNESNRKYLEEQTYEREHERDEFHKTIQQLHCRNEDLKREKERLSEVISRQKMEIDDYELRLKDKVETEQELIVKVEKSEDERTSAVEKIYQLREIIEHLESQVDSATANAKDLEEHNQILTEELEKLELIRKEQEEAFQITQDAVNTMGTDMTEELHAQVQDLTIRLEKKLTEMDNFPWQTRPNSSSSGTISISTEDVSVREFSYLNRDKDCTPREAGSLLCDGLRRLDTHFDSLVRFEEVIMKKLHDAELRLYHAKKRQEDLENERLVHQENSRVQINKISDLESRIDQFRFEPSPSILTLSDLRTRVITLTEEVEEYKGKLQLRNIELQDVTNRFASNQALFEKYKSTANRKDASIKKVYASVQTDAKIKRNESSAQTDHQYYSQPIIKPSTTEACVQTKSQSFSSNKKYQYFNHPSLELSTINGDPPKYSTPNNVNQSNQHQSIAENIENSLTLCGSGDGRSPEVLRASFYQADAEFVRSTEPVINKSVSFESENIRKEMFELEMEEDGHFDEMTEGGSGEQKGEGGRKTVLEQSHDLEDIVAHEQIENPSEDGEKIVRDLLDKIGIERFEKLSPQEKEYLICALREKIYCIDIGSAGGLERQKTKNFKLEENKGMKYEQTEQTINRIDELENVHPGDTYADKCTTRTTIVLDKYGNPTKGQTVLKEGLGSSVESLCTDDGKNNKRIRILIDTIEKQGIEKFSLQEKEDILRALKKRVICQRYSDPLRNVRSLDGSEIYTFQVAIVTSYEICENGELQYLGSKVTRAPDTSQAQKDRILDTDAKVKLETKKIEIDQLQCAIVHEKNTIHQLSKRLSKFTGQPIEDLVREASQQYRPNESSVSSVVSRINSNAVTQTEALSHKMEDIHSSQTLAVKQRDAEIRDLQAEVNSLNQHLNDKTLNEAQLLAELDNLMAILKSKNVERDELMQINQNHVGVIQQLQTQLDIAADQVRQASQMDVSPTRALGMNYFDLFLKMRSYRKALIWQKKYLMVVIQGYKDILRASGTGYEHPDLLQKTIPITPSCIGLLDHQTPKSRFKIIVRVVMAISRMKYMVRRWTSKVPKIVATEANKGSRSSNGPGSALSSRNCSSSSSSDKNLVLSPPTRDLKFLSSMGTATTILNGRRHSNPQSKEKFPNRKSSITARFPNVARRPIEVSSVPSSSNVSGTATILSQYLDRFEHLENELGSSLGRETHQQK